MNLNKQIISTYLIMVSSILFLFHYNLMTSFISGAAVYIIVKGMHDWLGTKYKSNIAHNITVALTTVLTILILTAFSLVIYRFLHMGNNVFQKITEDVINIIMQIRSYLPEYLVNYIPDDLVEIKNNLMVLLKDNIHNFLSVTKSSFKGFAHVVIGMLIGGVIVFSSLKEEKKIKESFFVSELKKRINTLVSVFQKVLFAQIKISSINAGLTGIYLLIILPLFNIHVPYASILVLLTFIFGLIPVIGNLITNTLITVLSLMISFEVALGSLSFLVIIHKLEYYINAKIVGNTLDTKIWELLIVMVVFEVIFGVIGVVLAPIIYGYIKEELKVNYLI